MNVLLCVLDTDVNIRKSYYFVNTWLFFTKCKVSNFFVHFYRAVYVPVLTCGHELWVVTKIIQAAKMWFCRVVGLSLRDRVRS